MNTRKYEKDKLIEDINAMYVGESPERLKAIKIATLRELEEKNEIYR